MISIYLQIGESWLSSDCKILYLCKPCPTTTCRLPVGITKESSHMCHSYQNCQPDSRGLGTCVAKQNGMFMSKFRRSGTV